MGTNSFSAPNGRNEYHGMWRQGHSLALCAQLIMHKTHSRPGRRFRVWRWYRRHERQGYAHAAQRLGLSNECRKLHQLVGKRVSPKRPRHAQHLARKEQWEDREYGRDRSAGWPGTNEMAMVLCRNVKTHSTRRSSVLLERFLPFSSCGATIRP